MTRNMIARIGALGVAVALLPTAVSAEGTNPATVTLFALTTTGYTQNFDTLAATGTTGTVLPTGWQIFEGTDGNATYAVGTGSNNAGGSYSFGATGSTDRALGSLGSGGVTPIYYGAVFTNALGSTITGLSFGYTGEQWRRGNSTEDALTFQYSLNATGVNSTGATWTSLSSLDFLSPASGTANGETNGNAITRLLSGSLAGLSIAQGSTFAIRFTDVNSAGNDDGLAIDNFGLTATTAVAAVPETATWAMMIVGFGVIGATARRRKAVVAVA